MHVRTLLISGVFALVLISTSRAQPNILLNDTFSDGERLTQSLPSSLAWYTTTAARPNIAVRNGALTLVANDNDRVVWGYFPAIALDIGDSLTFTVDVTFARAQNTSAALRIALCSTNGLVPRQSDGGVPSGRYQGYGSFTNTGDATAGTRVRKRNGPAAGNTTATLLELTDGATDVVWSTFGANRTGLNGALQANTAYTVVLTMKRTGVDAASITTSISGGALGANNSLTEIDSANVFLRFDTVAIQPTESTLSGDLLITRAQVVHEINTSRLANLSILTNVAAPGDSFTLGYVVGGSGTAGAKPLVIRAAGPSLGALGVSGTLDDPKLEHFAGAIKSGENDNWGGSSTIATAMAEVGAFAYSSAVSRDAAIVTTVTTTDNSVKVSATGSGTGTVIAELYDATPAASFTKSTPRLVNVSVLKQLGSGVTLGFVIGGVGNKTVLVRAVGPTLGTAPFNVGGVVADPQLALFSGPTNIASNDNWGGTAALLTAFGQVGAFALPATSRDAALLATLAPGNYTVQVSGVNSTSGVALVEVYEVP